MARIRVLPQIHRPFRGRRAAVLLACAFTAIGYAAAAPAVQAGTPQTNFVAVLSGSEEVPPVDTTARGQAKFRLSADGDALHFRLIVANIRDVTMAHLHNAPAGANGGVVAWLYPSGPPPMLIPGRTDGVLAEGTITGDNLVGALQGRSIADLVAEIEAGNIYANVHTEAHPGGEIRGQLS